MFDIQVKCLNMNERNELKGEFVTYMKAGARG